MASQIDARISAGAVGAGCIGAKPTSPRSSGHRVLLVEHDAPLRACLGATLAGAGYRVIPASHGLDGWCAYEVEQPELVVLDLDMPCISGFRLLRLLRTQTDTPVVLTTRYHLPTQPGATAREATRHETYLRKPFAPWRLVQLADRLLVRPR